MPDTGLFQVIDLDADRDELGTLKNVSAITIRCNRCRHVTHAKAPQLETMPGGTLLACGRCGERQAVSNARLVECDHVLGHTLPQAMPA
jgi:transcription elongation factor Elf1